MNGKLVQDIYDQTFVYFNEYFSEKESCRYDITPLEISFASKTRVTNSQR